MEMTNVPLRSSAELTRALEALLAQARERGSPLQYADDSALLARIAMTTGTLEQAEAQTRDMLAEWRLMTSTHLLELHRHQTGLATA